MPPTLTEIDAFLADDSPDAFERVVDRLLATGFHDTFRMFNTDGGNYTYWDFKTFARKRNVGWRIDYLCVNKDFASRLKRGWIMKDVMGSDHCPVAIELMK